MLRQMKLFKPNDQKNFDSLLQNIKIIQMYYKILVLINIDINIKINKYSP